MSQQAPPDEVDDKVSIEALREEIAQLKSTIETVQRERAEDRKRISELEAELGREKADTPACLLRRAS